jgi:hypothetical protein
MEEHTIAIVASNLTAAYFSGMAPHAELAAAPSATPPGDADADRFAAVIEKFHEFSAVLREQAHQEYEQAQREEEQIEQEQDDADKPIHVY